jgi:hypothetical protein
MTEAGIGRILAASLHQGIADLLPLRLEFYESWLNPDGMRHGTIGLAPMQAVLSFLRQEGEPYAAVTRRAGEYAAEWTFASQRPVGRVIVRSTPLWLRSRLVLRVARRAIRTTYVGSRAVLRVRNGAGRLEVSGSIFCNVRDVSTERLCGYYAAVVSRLLDLYGVPGDVHLEGCRAAGDPSCRIDVALGRHSTPPATSLTSSK